MPKVYRVHLKSALGYLCVDPADPTHIQYRPVVGAWEEVELTELPNGYMARFIAANVILCLTPLGMWETRTPGQHYAWETFLVTSQPPDWKTILLFRVEGANVPAVLQVEVKS